MKRRNWLKFILAGLSLSPVLTQAKPTTKPHGVRVHTKACHYVELNTASSWEDRNLTTHCTQDGALVNRSITFFKDSNDCVVGSVWTDQILHIVPLP